VMELQVQVAKLLRMLMFFKCKDLGGVQQYPEFIERCALRGEECDLNQIYTQLVEKLRILEKEVRSKVLPVMVFYNTPGEITINLNGLLSKETQKDRNWVVTTSFPAGSGECRHIMQPDLGIIYRMCADAGITCGHLLMMRDALEVVHSTTSNRHFMVPKMQVAVLGKAIKEMIAEASQFSDRLVGCFDYNDPTAGIGDWGESLLGYAVQDNSLKRTIDRLYRMHEPVSLNIDEMVLPGFELYIDTMVEATKHLRTLCKIQIKMRGATKQHIVPVLFTNNTL